MLYTHCQADGSGAWDLYLKVYEIKRMPYVWYDPHDREQNRDMYPQMVGKKVFLNAVRNMVVATNRALAKTGLTWKEIDWSARTKPIMSPVSCCGKKPLGTFAYR